MRGSFKSYINISLLALLIFIISSCSSKFFSRQKSVLGKGEYYTEYDDSVLTNNGTPLMMPYNRLIDPAGTTLHFGESKQENHSLDCIVIENGSVLVVEDRFGLAFFDVNNHELIYRLSFSKDPSLKGYLSTYTGVKALKTGKDYSLYTSVANSGTKGSFVLEIKWDGRNASITRKLAFDARVPALLALPNDLLIQNEGGREYLYVVLNGNSELIKLNLATGEPVWRIPTGMAPYGVTVAGGKIYVSNWAGPVPSVSSRETAGIPWAQVYIDPKTGATSEGTVSVFDFSGKKLNEIYVGLHPNDLIADPQGKFVYVANGNSDNISVIETLTDKVIDSISVRLDESDSFIGDSPNALALDSTGATLYVANGLDNAIAKVKLGENVSATGRGKTELLGFIPTGAYPCGIALSKGYIFSANLEGEGARVLSQYDPSADAGSKRNEVKAYNSHRQQATVSIIPVPDGPTIKSYTEKVKQQNRLFRRFLSKRLPRHNVSPKAVPERIGEPSPIKHVIYIIKENRTYDQILGDMPEGEGSADLCIFGKDVTPNHHKLAKDFVLLDNYYASGKSSAEGHQWTDAAMVTDYLEKNVRAWFRSYPHVQTDALVYNKKGFIWNQAADHGKSVRIYGEAVTPVYDKKLTWTDIYTDYLDKKPFAFHNVTTISRVKPLLCPTYPGFDDHRINDQIRADAFLKELKAYEQADGDSLPEFIILALPADHTAGTKPGLPTPRAKVADNDLAMGRIIEAVSNSRFWPSTAIFITEDDSQGGWDHVSAYRTMSFIISPYAKKQSVIHTNYNQTCLVRTMEQILGIPPMNIMDATALPMFDCFTDKPDFKPYTHLSNNIPLNEMNEKLSNLKGKALKYAIASQGKQYEHIDGGDDDLLNRIVWYSVKGNQKYPKKYAGHATDDDDDD